MRSRSLHSRFYSLCLLLTSLFVLAACGGSGTTPASGTSSNAPSNTGSTSVIKIGSLHPLTGSLSSDGKQMDQAVQQAIADVNAAGGITSLGGAKLQIDSADTQSQADVAKTQAQHLVNDKDVAIIGTYQSAATAEVAPTLERAQVPLVIDVTAADSILQQGYMYTFRLQPNATLMGTTGAQNLQALAAATGKPIKTIAYIHEQTEYGTGVFNAFKAEAEKEGMQVVKEIKYDAFKTTDLTVELSQIKALNPDILAVTGYYNDGLLLAKNAMAVAPSVKAVYGVADGAFDLPQFPGDAGKNGTYFFNSNYHFNSTSSDAQTVRDAFKAKTGQDMRTPAVYAYAAVKVIADSLERAKSTDPKAVRDAIAQTSLKTTLFPSTGPISFDSKGENKGAQAILMQVQNNKVVQLYPAQYSEAKPIFPATPWSAPAH